MGVGMQHSDWEKGLQESYGVLEIFYALPTGVGTNRIFFFFFFNKLFYLFIFRCVGSSLLRMGFL